MPLNMAGSPLANASNDLLELLTPELREKVEAGEYVIRGPGQNDKPVVVDTSGRIVKGSGRPLNANNPAVVGKVSAAKRTRTYNEALQHFVPVDRNGTPEAIVSLEEILQAAARVATGKPIAVTCPECEKDFMAPIGVDSKVLVWLGERLLGRATETKELNLRGEHLVRVLQDQTPIREIEVVALDPKERAERARAIREAFGD